MSMLRAVGFRFRIPRELSEGMGGPGVALPNMLELAIASFPEADRPLLQAIADIHQSNPGAITYTKTYDVLSLCDVFDVEINFNKVSTPVANPLVFMPSQVFVPSPELKLQDRPGRRLNFRRGTEPKEPAP